MDARSLVLALLALSWAVVMTCAQQAKIEKRDAESEDALSLLDDDVDADKRLFRYGRANIFRYGRAPTVFRYGKRGTVFRYGKRADEEADDDVEAIKRLFRWGKRDSDGGIKRLFRWGKRADEDDKRARHIFRYGKRDYDDDDEDDMFAEEDKRRIFNLGKKSVDDIQTRAEGPHVPFRFGDDERK